VREEEAAVARMRWLSCLMDSEEKDMVRVCVGKNSE
jgi:hypothetical protein